MGAEEAVVELLAVAAVVGEVAELPVGVALALPVGLSADFHHRVYPDLTVALEQVEEVVEATAYH